MPNKADKADKAIEVLLREKRGFRPPKSFAAQANVIVVKRTGTQIGWKEGRDAWWNDLMARDRPRTAS